MNAGSDGTTTVVVIPSGTTAADLCIRGAADGILEQLIDLAVPPPPVGVYRNHGKYIQRVTEKVRAALASMINSGVLTPAEAAGIEGCVVSQRAKK